MAMVSKSTENRVSGLCRNRQMSTQLRQILTAVAKNNNNNDIFHVIVGLWTIPLVYHHYCFFLRPCVSCRCPACVWDALAPGLYEPLSGNLKNRLVLILWSCVFQLASVRMNQLIRAVCPALPGSTYSALTNLLNRGRSRLICHLA